MYTRIVQQRLAQGLLEVAKASLVLKDGEEYNSLGVTHNYRKEIDSCISEEALSKLEMGADPLITRLGEVETQEFAHFAMSAMTYNWYPHLLTTSADRMAMFLFYQFVMEKVGIMDRIVRQKDFEIFMTMELSPLFTSDDDLVDTMYKMLRHQ